MNDTSADVDRRYFEMVMALSPERRLKMAAAMFTTARKLVEAAIRRDLGELDQRELRRELLKRLYGQDLPASILAGILGRM